MVTGAAPGVFVGMSGGMAEPPGLLPICGVLPMEPVSTDPIELEETEPEELPREEGRACGICPDADLTTGLAGAGPGPVVR